jgi:hypothetical protein
VSFDLELTGRRALVTAGTFSETISMPVKR